MCRFYFAFIKKHEITKTVLKANLNVLTDQIACRQGKKEHILKLYSFQNDIRSFLLNLLISERPTPPEFKRKVKEKYKSKVNFFQRRRFLYQVC